MIELLRDQGVSDLVSGDAVETLAAGFQFTEGPLGLEDGSLLFQDMKAGRTYRLELGGEPVLIRERTRGANGQTFDARGQVVFCEQDGRRVSRMAPDGSGVETVVETWAGRRLNSPNDIVCRSDGQLYFTDPPYGVEPEDREIDFQGVYTLDEAGEVRSLADADDFEKPNGLAFSPDERTLYVCDTGRYHVRAFEIEPGGDLRPGSGRVVATMDPGRDGGPDGIKVDREGRLYVAVALGIWVFEPTGRLLGIIALPNRPSNLAWMSRDGRSLAVTAGDTVYRVGMNVEGQLPPFLPTPG